MLAGPGATEHDDVPAAVWDAADIHAVADRYGNDAARWAAEVLVDALKDEPQITRDVVDAIGPGAHAAALEWRVKGLESLARKVRDRADRVPPEGEEPAGAEGAASRITDVLRYTVCADKEADLAGAVVHHVHALRRRGYAVVESEHSYVDGSGYKGIHFVWRSPGEAERHIEVQYHSARSLEVKERTHEIYGQVRAFRGTAADRRAQVAEMARLSEQLRPPPGLQGIDARLGLTLTPRRK